MASFLQYEGGPVDRKTNDFQLWSIADVFLGAVVAWLLFSEWRAGFGAGMVLAFAITNITFLAFVEDARQALYYGSMRAKAAYGALFVASILLMVWSIPLALAYSQKPS